VALAVMGATTAAAAGWTVDTYTAVFAPDTLTVAVGDTVTWLNRTPARHLLIFAGDPEGRGRSEVQQGLAGEPYVITVKVPGRYPYRCAIHGMYAELVVVPARNLGR
jgi:plastocyanin